MAIKLDAPFMILRGWPGGSRERYLPVATSSGSYVALSSGDVVDINTSGQAVKSTSNQGVGAGFVVEGNQVGNIAGLVSIGSGATQSGSVNPADSMSTVGAGKVAVLFGNFIAKTIKYNSANMATIAVPGAMLTVKAGVLDIANGTTDPVVGKVIAVGTAAENGFDGVIVPITFVAF